LKSNLCGSSGALSGPLAIASSRLSESRLSFTAGLQAFLRLYTVLKQDRSISSVTLEIILRYNEDGCGLYGWTDIRQRKFSDELLDQELSATGRQSTGRQTSSPDVPHNVVFDLYDFTGRTVRVRVTSTFTV